MIVSTRGRYALRVMIDLAEQHADTYIPLKEIAERQDISQKYLEGIMTALSKGGLIEAVHGKGGGYKLNRPPESYSVRDILLITEESLAPVACLSAGADQCPRESQCRTLPLWRTLNDMISGYLATVTIADFMQKNG